MWQKLGFLSESFMESLWHFVASKIIELNRPLLEILVLFWPVYCSMEKLWIDTLKWQSLIAWLQFDEKIDTQRNRNKCKLDNFLKFDDSDTNVGRMLDIIFELKIGLCKIKSAQIKQEDTSWTYKSRFEIWKVFLKHCELQMSTGPRRCVYVKSRSRFE